MPYYTLEWLENEYDLIVEYVQLDACGMVVMDDLRENWKINHTEKRS